MTKELTTQPNTFDLAVPGKHGNGHSVTITGLDDMERGDMILPRLRVVQAQTAFSEAVGQLHNSLTDTAKPFVHAVFLAVRKSRVMWPSGFERGQDPTCASDDAVSSRTNMSGAAADGKPTTHCDKCIFSAWQDSTPPECSMFYNFMGVDIDEGDMPFLVSFGRTSAKAGKQLITLLKTFGLKRTFVISTEQQKNDKGKFYILSVKAGELLNAEQQTYYADLARSFSSVSITADTDGAEGYEKTEDPMPF